MKRALVVSAFALGMLVACGKDKGSQHPLLGDWKLPARAGAAAGALVPGGVTLNEVLRVENNKVTVFATCTIGVGAAKRTSPQISVSAPATLEKDKLIVRNSARVTTPAGVVPPCTADVVGGNYAFTVSGTQLTLEAPVGAPAGAAVAKRTASRLK